MRCLRSVLLILYLALALGWSYSLRVGSVPRLCNANSASPAKLMLSAITDDAAQGNGIGSLIRRFVSSFIKRTSPGSVSGSPDNRITSHNPDRLDAQTLGYDISSSTSLNAEKTQNDNNLGNREGQALSLETQYSGTDGPHEASPLNVTVDEYLSAKIQEYLPILSSYFNEARSVRLLSSVFNQSKPRDYLDVVESIAPELLPIVITTKQNQLAQYGVKIDANNTFKIITKYPDILVIDLPERLRQCYYILCNAFKTFDREIFGQILIKVPKILSPSMSYENIVKFVNENPQWNSKSILIERPSIVLNADRVNYTTYQALKDEFGGEFDVDRVVSEYPAILSEHFNFRSALLHLKEVFPTTKLRDIVERHPRILRISSNSLTYRLNVMQEYFKEIVPIRSNKLAWLNNSRIAYLSQPKTIDEAANLFDLSDGNITSDNALRIAREYAASVQNYGSGNDSAVSSTFVEVDNIVVHPIPNYIQPIHDPEEEKPRKDFAKIVLGNFHTFDRYFSSFEKNLRAWTKALDPEIAFLFLDATPEALPRAPQTLLPLVKYLYGQIAVGKFVDPTSSMVDEAISQEQLTKKNFHKLAHASKLLKYTPEAIKKRVELLHNVFCKREALPVVGAPRLITNSHMNRIVDRKFILKNFLEAGFISNEEGDIEDFIYHNPKVLLSPLSAIMTRVPFLVSVLKSFDEGHVRGAKASQPLSFFEFGKINSINTVEFVNEVQKICRLRGIECDIADIENRLRGFLLKNLPSRIEVNTEGASVLDLESFLCGHLNDISDKQLLKSKKYNSNEYLHVPVAQQAIVYIN